MRLSKVQLDAIRERVASQRGFTMIVALGVMLVTSLLLVAAFTAVSGDAKLSHEDLTQKQAYYAALAGVQSYEYQLERNPNFWQTCEPVSATQPGESNTRYEVELLVASSAPTGTEKCTTAKPFESVIESKGRASNTFRVKATGYAGKDKRSLIATFGVKGFLDYVYFTRFEEEDPTLDEAASVEKCSQERGEGRLAYEEEERKKKVNEPCGPTIEFAPEDAVRGPMHTDDAAAVCEGPEFGRKARLEEKNPDAVEIRGGTYAAYGGCSNTAVVYTTSGKPAVGEEAEILVPPEEDTSLGAYVESGYEFEGVTTLELEGKEVTVTNAQYNGGKPKKIPLPKNGLIYIRSQSSPACNYEYEQTNADTAGEIAEEVHCGTAYVKGNYAESLTIGAEREVVIKGSLVPTGVTPPATNHLPAGELPGTATLGLIATKFVRIYHPCTGGTGSSKEEGLHDPWIDAAILSTSHSFLVDNYQCGKQLGYLNTDGAIAQNFRGIVGLVGASGYLKNYNYDERLATDEPPYFLAPLKAGWRIVRETAPTGG
jgi:hypothetical protein